MNYKELIVQSILGGISIGIGGVFYLSIQQPIIAAFFFAFGLCTIVTRKHFLFTGRISYIFENDRAYALGLPITWICNLIGTQIVAFAISFTRHAPILQEKAIAVCDTKLSDGALSVFILGIFCNLLVHTAIDGFRTNPHEVGKYIMLFLCIVGFILAGFEHCIANMFYFGLAGKWSVHAVIWLLIMTAGNIVGGLIFPVCRIIIGEHKKSEN